MDNEVALILAFKHAPKDIMGKPSDWVLAAIKEAHTIGRQEAYSQMFKVGEPVRSIPSDSANN